MLFGLIPRWRPLSSGVALGHCGRRNSSIAAAVTRYSFTPTVPGLIASVALRRPSFAACRNRSREISWRSAAFLRENAQFDYGTGIGPGRSEPFSDVFDGRQFKGLDASAAARMRLPFTRQAATTKQRECLMPNAQRPSSFGSSQIGCPVIHELLGRVGVSRPTLGCFHIAAAEKRNLVFRRSESVPRVDAEPIFLD